MAKPKVPETPEVLAAQAALKQAKLNALAQLKEQNAEGKAKFAQLAKADKLITDACKILRTINYDENIVCAIEEHSSDLGRDLAQGVKK
jgi:hypothetical protein